MIDRPGERKMSKWRFKSLLRTRTKPQHDTVLSDLKSVPPISDPLPNIPNRVDPQHGLLCKGIAPILQESHDSRTKISVTKPQIRRVSIVPEIEVDDSHRDGDAYPPVRHHASCETSGVPARLGSKEKHAANVQETVYDNLVDTTVYVEDVAIEAYQRYPRNAAPDTREGTRLPEFFRLELQRLVHTHHFVVAKQQAEIEQLKLLLVQEKRVNRSLTARLPRRPEGTTNAVRGKFLPLLITPIPPPGPPTFLDGCDVLATSSPNTSVLSCSQDRQLLAANDDDSDSDSAMSQSFLLTPSTDEFYFGDSTAHTTPEMPPEAFKA
jgi:hypothetical protein